MKGKEIRAFLRPDREGLCSREKLCNQEEIDRGMAEELRRSQGTFGVTIAVMQGMMICFSLLAEGGPFATPSSRAYFLLYCALFLATLVGTYLTPKVRRKSPRAQLRLQWFYCVAICLWACGISTLDSQQGSGLVVFSYILPTVGALGMLPTGWAAVLFGGSWVLLNVLVGLTPEGQANLFGNVINSSFSTIVAVFIARQMYVTRCRALNSQAQVQHLAVTDQLTGLFNRRFMDESLAPLLGDASRLGQPFVGMMIDIDYFKTFNDRFGHQAGDNCLKQITGLLLDKAREDVGFYPVRYGGEEFLVCWLNCTGGYAAGWAEELRSQVAELRIPGKDGGESRVTVSVGLCQGTAGEDLYSLIRKADTALYQAKTRGRDQLFVAEEP